jgi:hypothetical protein
MHSHDDFFFVASIALELHGTTFTCVHSYDKFFPILNIVVLLPSLLYLSMMRLLFYGK